MKILKNKETQEIYEFQDNENPADLENWKEASNSDIDNLKKCKLRQKLIDSRKQYFKLTDWYCQREIDIPNSYPQEIKDKRNQAREEIGKIEKAKTLAALNKFSTTFE